MTKLFYAGTPGTGTGWGTCNANLIKELSKLCELSFGDGGDVELKDCIVFQPIADHALRPSTNVRGWKNVGYTFFEFPLEPEAAENAKQYDVIFCGSTWCQERLAERGIKAVVLIQGVDHEIFKPGEVRPPDGEFWIFSGGKFEYRKGQDLVLAAFKEILKSHPKAKLITAWQNPWPQLCDTMAESKHIKYELKGDTWQQQLGHLCDINGIPKERVLTLPGIIPNAAMADIYRQCDLGLFPNRCEGGTNLVMMEFMACGRPVVATIGTGHKDVMNNGMLALPLIGPLPVEISVAVNIAVSLAKSVGLESMGLKAAKAMKQWTWERAARTILENV